MTIGQKLARSFALIIVGVVVLLGVTTFLLSRIEEGFMLVTERS